MYFVVTPNNEPEQVRSEELAAMCAMAASGFIYFEADLCSPENVLRHYHKDLQDLNSSGRPCEACERPMHNHGWVDLDTQGFVVRCNFKP